MPLLSTICVLLTLVFCASSHISPPPKTCPTGVRILACSGHGRAPHGYGKLQSTVESFLSAIPDSTNYSIPYPKRTPDPAYATSVGAQLLTWEIGNYTQYCPTTPIVLVGYSLGGIVVMNTICGRSHIGAPYGPPLPRKYAKHILATVTYGEETRVPYQSYDVGTCKKGHGLNPRGNPYGCEAFASGIQSYCDKPDPRCCNGGKNVAAHFLYPQKYDGAATEWVSSRYNAQ